MADIAVTELAGFGLASVLPRKGVQSDAISAALGFAVLPGPVESRGSNLALWGTGPGQWLAHTTDAVPDWADALGDRLAGLATVVDQSGAYAVLQVAGADACRLLQKGLAVDLSPAAFAPGAVLVSVIAHIGVILHHAAPGSYHVLVFRSFSGSFRDWLQASIAAL